jgi:hypothetical protein
VSIFNEEVAAEIGTAALLVASGVGALYLAVQAVAHLALWLLGLL